MTELTPNEHDCLSPGVCRAPQFMAEIKRLTSENTGRLLQKAGLEDEIKRLSSSPTVAETDELITRLNEFSEASYGQKGCDLSREAAETLHRLARNQMTADYVRVSQAAAIQAQNADAQTQRADALDHKCSQFTEALLKAMTLVDELLRENVRLCATSKEPPNVKLFTAKNGFDAAMHKLLGD